MHPNNINRGRVEKTLFLEARTRTIEKHNMKVLHDCSMHPIIGSMLQKIQTEIRPNGVKNKRAAPAYKLGAIEGKCELI